MLVPVSWIKDYVDIDIPIELLAERLTTAGLEIAHITYIGLPQTKVEGIRMPESKHLVWDRELLLLGKIVEVKEHPDADKLVLAMVDYGGDELEQCVTGAPNLFGYKGKGEINPPIWTAFAKEGAMVWDGHSEEAKLMTLKGKALRGVYNKSMVCSEKELGISDEHEGIIIMQDDTGYVAGTAISDVLGDIVLEVELTPNLARCFSVIGVAREVAALLNKPMKYPSFDFLAEGDPIEGQVTIDIQAPELNPRFTLTLLKDTKVQPAPFWMQYRLRLAGQRPINNIVDVTNYITFEIGQPLHAYDYDKLIERTGANPTIITRLPHKDETLKTLDGVTRKLGEESILVVDNAGVLGLGGVMGGEESEIGDDTKNVLLEAAAWNNIGIRKTIKDQKLFTEASTRFSRGVHPSQAILGNQRGIELMRQTGGGKIAKGIIDVYPIIPATVEVDLPIAEVTRLLGMAVEIDKAAAILKSLQFEVTVKGDSIHALVPDHRMDISDDPVIGQADLIEEIARIIGYDNIPDTIMADEMPAQHENVSFVMEERIRDLMVEAGLHEVINYRFTHPDIEKMLIPEGAQSSLPDARYVEVINPSASDRNVLRHTLMINMLDNAINNARYKDRQLLFEVGKIYLQLDDRLPLEPRRLGILMSGSRHVDNWMHDDSTQAMDFFDLKGVIEGLLRGLHISDYKYERGTHTTYHPGRSANLIVKGNYVGTFGELHPKVAQKFKLTDAPVMLAELDLERLVRYHQRLHPVSALPTTPAILEDIALIVRNEVTNAEVEDVIRKAGGRLLKDVQLFDVYRGEPIPAGHRSLAYSLTYRDDEETLTDKQAAKVRGKIVNAAQHQLGATLRS